MTLVESGLAGSVIQVASALRRPVESKCFSGSISRSSGARMVRNPGAMFAFPRRVVITVAGDSAPTSVATNAGCKGFGLRSSNGL